jgi:hypothetical protein
LLKTKQQKQTAIICIDSGRGEDNMRNAWGRILTILITGMMLFASFIPAASAEELTGYEAYDPDQAISYAKKHWDDGKGLCATFVSRCVTSGGIRFTKASDKTKSRTKSGIYSGCWGLYKDLSARPFVTVSVLKDTKGRFLWSANSGKVAPGDVVFLHAKGDNSTGQYKHVVLVSGDKNKDTIKYYAHNVARNGHRNLVPQSGYEMVVIHFRGYNDYNTYYATHGRVKTAKETALKTFPCSEKTYAKSKTAEVLEQGTEVEVVRLVRNDRGNYWYEVIRNGKRDRYLYAGDVKWIGWDGSDISIKDVELPKGSIKAGKNASIKGTVKSKYNQMSQISGTVYRGGNVSGKALLSADTKLKGKTSVSIGKTDLGKIRISALGVCGDYTFAVRVRCDYAYADGNRLVQKCSDGYLVTTSAFKIQ